MSTAFIGLGTMGYRMAGRLASAVPALRVYNRTPARSRLWQQEHGGAVAESPAEAARGASVVVCCLSDDDAVRSVALGPQGAFQAMAQGSVFVDHSTTSAVLARELAQQAARSGIGFLDAPVTGGKPGAAQGTLSCMVGGEAHHLEAARSVLERYTKLIAHVGPAGAGQIAKMANQVCIGGILQSLAEALALAERTGGDAAQVLAVLQTGSGRSWQMDSRGAPMLEAKYDFGFSVEWLAKDLGLCLEQAQAAGLELPGTHVAAGSYRALLKRGHGQEDVAAVMRLFREGDAS